MTDPDSTGREALREAARIEAAAFYGRAAGDTTPAKRATRKQADTDAVEAANKRATVQRHPAGKRR